MAMVVDDTIADLDLSGHSTLTTTTTTTTPTSTQDGHGCNWNDWSSVINWDGLSGSHDNFEDLFECTMDDNTGSEGCSIVFPHQETMVVEEETNHGAADDIKGLRLVHLLMAAAEALTGVNKSRDLAWVILVRLKELVSPHEGTNMERLAAHFSEALQSLLEGTGSKHMLSNGPNHHDDQKPMDILTAFQLLQDMSVRINFIM